jgi:hypothetical protein
VDVGIRVAAAGLRGSEHPNPMGGTVVPRVKPPLTAGRPNVRAW